MSKVTLRYRHCNAKVSQLKYENVFPTDSICEANLIKGNNRCFGFSWKVGGGGSLALLDHNNPRKLGAQFASINGHKGAIIDFDFYPFDDNFVATASDDCTIKLWQIPEQLDDNLNLLDAATTLEGHGKKASLIQWNPTSEFVLASSSLDDTVKVWDVQNTANVFTIDGNGQYATDINWNRNGNLIASTWKDKQFRIIDPRQQKFTMEGAAHDGPKSQKICFLGDSGYFVTTGWAKSTSRQVLLFDMKDASKPVQNFELDQSSGMLYPYYDESLQMLYVCGKGDSSFKFYEFIDNSLHFANTIATPGPAKAYGFAPKTACNVMSCEVQKCLKLTANSVELLSLIIPRKDPTFQADLFPDCPGNLPSQTAGEWWEGKDAPVKLVSLAPGAEKVQGKATFTAVNPAQEIAELKDKIAQLEAQLSQKDVEIADLKSKVG